MLRTTLARCLVFTVISASAQAEYREVHNLSIDAASLSQFVVDVGAGDLEILGDANATDTTVEATIIVEGVSNSRAQEFVKNHVKVELFRKGEKGQLNSIIGSRNTSWLSRMVSGSMSVRADLVVVVPHNIALDIDDGSRHILLERLNQPVRIDDDSGDIKIKHIAGALSIKDDSGHIDIRHLTGVVTIEDDSGDIDLGEISQDVIILRNGSGSLRLGTVGGAIKMR